MADRDLVLGQLAELFRQRGYASTSLPEITAATGLGKGSLYNLFPGGKMQMLTEVIADVSGWFEREVFTPLEAQTPDIRAMLDAVSAYFDSGRRLCLAGRIGLEPDLDELGDHLDAYFARWQEALASALARTGRDPDLAEEMIVALQGALVVAHARRDPAVFGRTIERLAATLAGLPAR